MLLAADEKISREYQSTYSISASSAVGRDRTTALLPCTASGQQSKLPHSRDPGGRVGTDQKRLPIADLINAAAVGRDRKKELGGLNGDIDRRGRIYLFHRAAQHCHQNTVELRAFAGCTITNCNQSALRFPRDLQSQR